MADQQDAAPESAGTSKSAFIILGIAVLLAAASIAYNVMGSQTSTAPEPLAEGVQMTLEQLQERAEASPDNALAWQELGFAQFQGGEFNDAVSAYERAVEIDDTQAVLWSALGEARVMASPRDPMPPEALEAFQRANAIEPSDPRSRYFLAVKQDLDGDHEGAIQSWLDLLKDTPVGAPWEEDLARTIDQVGRINNIDVEDRLAAVLQERLPAQAMAAPDVRGPTQEQIAAAGSMSADDQRQMAVGMVEQLEQRLAGDPSNLDGWVMLMRSRMTLGEPGKARAALDAAIAANPAAEPGLRAQAQQLGIE